MALLFVIAGVSRRARKTDSLADFYLANRGLGTGVLLLTLFATQYSGNSLSGFPGQTYRGGLTYYMSVTFMCMIVTGYLLFAPRLFRLSRRHRFITPSDYLTHRFANPLLSRLAALVFAVTLINFLLAQLMAMGHAFAGLTEGRIPYWAGVAGGAAVILIYELLGGMRAVAWTDALQGSLLILGLLFVVVLLISIIGPPAAVLARIAEVAPEKVAAPSYGTAVAWFSNIVLIGLGAPLYPQAIQRIYAARRLTELKRALAVMAFLPHFAITTVVFLGLAGIAVLPTLSGPESDQVTFRVLAFVVENRPIAFLPVIMVMMAVVAAIMSTADSCLLSLSSIVTEDLLPRRRLEPAATGEAARRLSPRHGWVSILIMAVLVPLALRPLTTLWDLLVLKFELLIQLSPAFVLGTAVGPKAGAESTSDRPTYDRRAFAAPEVVAGLIVGTGLAVALSLSGNRLVGGLHAGVIGLGANYLVVVAGRSLRRRSATDDGRRG